MRMAWELPGAREPHICTLPGRHFGPHLCWCGCIWRGALVYGRLLRLADPLGDDDASDHERVAGPSDPAEQE
jgi:hypothetical protein